VKTDNKSSSSSSTNRKYITYRNVAGGGTEPRPHATCTKMWLNSAVWREINPRTRHYNNYLQETLSPAVEAGVNANALLTADNMMLLLLLLLPQDDDYKRRSCSYRCVCVCVCVCTERAMRRIACLSTRSFPGSVNTCKNGQLSETREKMSKSSHDFI